MNQVWILHSESMSHSFSKLERQTTSSPNGNNHLAASSESDYIQTKLRVISDAQTQKLQIRSKSHTTEV